MVYEGAASVWVLLKPVIRGLALLETMMAHHSTAQEKKIVPFLVIMLVPSPDVQSYWLVSFVFKTCLSRFLRNFL